MLVSVSAFHSVQGSIVGQLGFLRVFRGRSLKASLQDVCLRRRAIRILLFSGPIMRAVLLVRVPLRGPIYTCAVLYWAPKNGPEIENYFKTV